MDIYLENKAYWQGRAQGYSEVNKEELAGVQRKNWTSFLNSQIIKQFPGRQLNTLRILDVGAGPGFISIILAEAGYQVTAIDFSEEMIKEAKKNAGVLSSKVTYVQGDAMELPFDNDSFDVVFSRNLTWNIPFPEKAYREWVRVLKKNGLMLVFDANWYSHLVDDNKFALYQKDRENVAAHGLEDYNIGENFDKMDAIAAKMPATSLIRPEWDKDYLESIEAGFVEIREDIGSILYSEKEKINYRATPLFMVKLIKK